MLCVSAEGRNKSGSFAASLGAHTGIGTLPIVFFGNDAQRRKYLPKLASGELLAAYALTESEAGSDALSGKTRADLSADGTHYVLNGTKMWITNGAFADLYIVFAKVGGKDFSAFIVERPSPGFSVGAEEHKLGIRGSSTTSLTFEDVKVPVENLLGEIGKGHKIAFNILNVGRFKLGVGTLGGAKEALRVSIEYATTRKQFKKPLSDFGLIKAKMGDMAAGIFAVESMAYRLSGLMDSRIAQIPEGAADYQTQVVNAIEEYVVEQSILKIAGSELMDFAADEALQIHGGYGYSEEYAPERLVRDSRINRIFEGTNEINRMLIPGTLLKRAMKGQLPLMDGLMKLDGELANGAMKGLGASLTAFAGGPLADAALLAELGKRLTLYCLNAATQKYMMELQDQQEVLATLADLITDAYGQDSAVARAQRLIGERGEKASHAVDLARLFTHDAYHRIHNAAQMLVESISEGDELKAHHEKLAKLSHQGAFPRHEVRRRVADTCIEAGGYKV